MLACALGIRPRRLARVPAFLAPVVLRAVDGKRHASLIHAFAVVGFLVLCGARGRDAPERRENEERNAKHRLWPF